MALAITKAQMDASIDAYKVQIIKEIKGIEEAVNREISNYVFEHARVSQLERQIHGPYDMYRGILKLAKLPETPERNFYLAKASRESKVLLLTDNWRPITVNGVEVATALCTELDDPWLMLKCLESMPKILDALREESEKYLEEFRGVVKWVKGK